MLSFKITRGHVITALTGPALFLTFICFHCQQKVQRELRLFQGVELPGAVKLVSGERGT